MPAGSVSAAVAAAGTTDPVIGPADVDLQGGHRDVRPRDRQARRRRARASSRSPCPTCTARRPAFRRGTVRRSGRRRRTGVAADDHRRRPGRRRRVGGPRCVRPPGAERGHAHAERAGPEGSVRRARRSGGGPRARARTDRRVGGRPRTARRRRASGRSGPSRRSSRRRRGSRGRVHAPTAPDPPVRVRLPALGVDAPVAPVGVDDRGRMAVPLDVATVGWYRFGSGPGATEGSAVLSGHVDDREQGYGAFHKLGDLHPATRSPSISAMAASGLPRGSRQPVPEDRSPRRRGVRP